MRRAEEKEQKCADTLMLICPVCGSDCAETLGVTGAMRSKSLATVVMHCVDCKTVYLSPVPVGGTSSDDWARIELKVYEQHVGDLKRRVPSDTKFLCADRAEASILARDPATERFDNVLLRLTLESSNDPTALLSHASQLLDERGTIEIVCGNTDGSCFETFGGRHWYGYGVPGGRQFFNPASTRLAAEKAGLHVLETRSAASAQAWLLSFRNLLVDWGFHRTVITFFTGPWLIPWLVASGVELIASMRGKAAVLVVNLRKD